MGAAEFLSSVKCPKCGTVAGAYFPDSARLKGPVLIRHLRSGGHCLDISERENFDLTPALAEHVEGVLKAAQEKLNGTISCG